MVAQCLRPTHKGLQTVVRCPLSACSTRAPRAFVAAALCEGLTHIEVWRWVARWRHLDAPHRCPLQVLLPLVKSWRCGSI